MTGRYAQFQPVYAGFGISTIPVSTDSKKPLVSNYLRMGLPASNQLAIKFTEANAIGIVCGQHNGITTLDADSTDEGVLKEAIYRAGEPRVIEGTPSGKYHAYYRWNGEKRLIRPWKDLPVDILGGGMVIVTPSLFGSGEYHFLEGNFDDLVRLAPMRNLECATEIVPRQPHVRASIDGRNNWLFRECGRAARKCRSLEEMVATAHAKNLECIPPMEDSEVSKIAGNVWSMQRQGRNRFGTHGAWIPAFDLATLMREPDVLALLAHLQANQGPWGYFLVPNSLADEFEMDRRRFAAARRRLIELGYIKMVRAANSAGYAATYEWA
jgi:hypothetical protein